jgi:hypothetical protein
MATTTASGNEISPAIPSGFPRMKIFMLLGAAYLTLVYILVHLFFPQLVQLLSLPPLAAEFCPDGISGCQRADLFAFGAACGQALAFCGLTGFVAWHINKAPMTKIPQTPEGRLFGHIEEADWLTASAVTFQLWDLVISILIPEHCTAIMIGHHIMAALVAWYGLNNQVCRRRHRVDASRR